MNFDRKRRTQTRSRRKVSYSRNVFLPITNLCRNRCAYCGFRRDPNDGAWFMLPEKVLDLTKRAKAAGCSEALLTLGERPEVYAEAKEKLDKFGHESIVGYLEDLCRRILKAGLLPHTNAGLLSKQELRCLRRYNASMGLMLESSKRLPAHRKSPGKNPGLRLRMIKMAGELKIPFTTGILVGVGESLEDRIQSLLEIRKLHRKYGHIQEVIIQPFVPKPETPMSNHSAPSRSDLLNTVAIARSIMPEMNIQIPPNLIPHVTDFLLAGVNDLGGISTVTPDFINPENPWPPIKKLRIVIRDAGFEPLERLPIYPEFIKKDGFMSSRVEAQVRELIDGDGYRCV